MIAAELRGGSKPSLNEALGWIGSRVDDIYGASVGRLEDVWIDPGTGVPRWLLVKEGRFGGRTTLIPFEDATAGAGHVWVPYEREIVRDAPEIAPGAPLTQQVEAALRTHYAAYAPAAVSHRGQPPRHPSPEPAPSPGPTTIRFATGPADPEQPQSAPPHLQGATPAPLPARPAPPIAGPEAAPPAYEPQQQPPPASATQAEPSLPREGWQQQPAGGQDPQGWEQPAPPAPAPADPAQSAADALAELAGSGRPHYVEIELSGELQIRGDLRSVRIIPRDPDAPNG